MDSDIQADYRDPLKKLREMQASLTRHKFARQTLRHQRNVAIWIAAISATAAIVLAVIHWTE